MFLHGSLTLLHQQQQLFVSQCSSMFLDVHLTLLQQPLVASCVSNPTTSAATTACCFMCIQPYYNSRLLLQHPTLLQPLVVSASNPTASAAKTTRCIMSIQPYYNSCLLLQCIQPYYNCLLLQHPTLLQQQLSQAYTVTSLN